MSTAGAGWDERRVSRRGVLAAAAALGLGTVVGRSRVASALAPALPTGPGLRPHPKLPEGTDTLPQIDHIVVVMQENHSYDNYFGMLGRGDGFPRTRRGLARLANADASGKLVEPFPMPSTCQLVGEPDQSWSASHVAYASGKNDGFVLASGPVAMGYWTPDDLPFYSSLARTFVLADRWFSSTLGKTFPNRRFLLAGTASGHIVNDLQFLPEPPNGTILQLLSKHGISWRDYYTNLPTAGLFPSAVAGNGDKLVRVDQFFDDAARGALPAFCLVEPNFFTQSEENPQDIRQGEAFAARVINAAMHGPAWPKTLVIWCYDEHGGYYDHVPPPRAVPPDSIAPQLAATDPPGAYDRYGFRVPAVVVSPRARKHHVSHTIYDHTSILKLVETKWNLPALTARDAHANDLLDCLDLEGHPAFLHPPRLAAPALDASSAACAPITPESISGFSAR
jgi:phospholipase C